MNGRRLLLAAAAAGIVAAAGMLAAPLLPARHRSHPADAVLADPAPAGLTRLAVDTATAQLRCDQNAAVGDGCGWLTVTGAAGYPASPGTVIVRLVGTLTTRTGVSVPVALRVRLTRTGGTWTPAVVTP